MKMNSNIIRRALLLLGDGKCKSANELKRLLNVDEALFGSILGLLISEGIIEEIKYYPSCGKCFTRNSCPIALKCGSGSIRMYRLSSRGKRVLEVIKET